MLFVDKYRPNTLDKMDYHQEQAAHLKEMVASGDFPHLLFYGPNGAGKKTRVMALLRATYGPGVEKLRVEHRVFSLPSGSKIELHSVASNYHLELNPSDAGIHDRHIVQDVIKEIAQSQPLESNSFKVVVLGEVNSLSREAQHALRRTMEKYAGTCRLILISNTLSKVLDPIRSRCLAIRVGAPSVDSISSILTGVSRKENLNLPPELATRIAVASGRNLRRSLLMLETCRVAKYPFDPKQSIQLPDWERFVSSIAQDIVKSQDAGSLLKVRSKLYEVLSHAIPPEVVLKTLVQELLKVMDNVMSHSIVEHAAFYEHRVQLGSKPIFHLEAFVAKVMALYKSYLIQSTGMY